MPRPDGRISRFHLPIAIICSALLIGFPGTGGPGTCGGMGRHSGGRGYPPQESRPDGKKVLEQISQPTGGRLFEVSKKLPVDQIYA